MRVPLILALLAGFAGAAAAQTPPQQQQQRQPAPPPPSTANVNLRPIPDGPGKRVAELQGLDKVTARTQRFYAPVGESTRFGTLAITVGDCLVNVPEAPPESVAYLTIVDNKPGQAALSALDHGVYDVRVLSCTMAQASSAPSSR